MLGYSNFRDMIDGGGAGRSGKQFKGGILSDALNSIGVRPAAGSGVARDDQKKQPQRVSAPQYRAQPAPQYRAQPAPQYRAQPAPQYRAQPAPQAQPQVAPDYSVAPYAAPQMMHQVQQEAPQIGLLSPVGAREATYGIPAMMQMPQEPQMRDVRQLSSDPQFQDYMRELQMFNRMYGVY